MDRNGERIRETISRRGAIRQRAIDAYAANLDARHVIELADDAAVGNVREAIVDRESPACAITAAHRSALGGATRDAALEALRTELEQQISGGELVFLDVEPKGLLGLAGKYKDDPTLREICEEAYRQRDAQKAAEFPE